VDALRRELKMKDGVAIELRKTTPRGGDGAAGPATRRRHCLGILGDQEKIERDRLFEIAAHSGLDVPFFLEGGEHWASARATKSIRFPAMKTGVLLVKTNIHHDSEDGIAELNAR